MRAVRVDFRRPRQVPKWLAVVAIAAMTGLLGWQVWRVVTLERELGKVRAESAALDSQIQAAREKRRQLDERAQQAAQTPEARMLAKINAFPLDEVLTSVESSRTEGIRLTLLDISAVDGVVRAECEYANTDALLRYVEKLNETSKSTPWQITQLRATGHDNSGAGIAILIARSAQTGR
jgi:hypothetical protein